MPKTHLDYWTQISTVLCSFLLQLLEEFSRGLMTEVLWTIKRNFSLLSTGNVSLLVIAINQSNVFSFIIAFTGSRLLFSKLDTLGIRTSFLFEWVLAYSANLIWVCGIYWECFISNILIWQTKLPTTGKLVNNVSKPVLFCSCNCHGWWRWLFWVSFALENGSTKEQFGVL